MSHNKRAVRVNVGLPLPPFRRGWSEWKAEAILIYSFFPSELKRREGMNPY